MSALHEPLSYRSRLLKTGVTLPSARRGEGSVRLEVVFSAFGASPRVVSTSRFSKLFKHVNGLAELTSCIRNAV